MDRIIKAVVMVVIAAVLAYILLYLIPTRLPSVTYSFRLPPQPMVIVESSVPSIVHITTYNGAYVQVNGTIIYNPPILKPSLYYTVKTTNGTLYIDALSTTCPPVQFYPIYTCIVYLTIYIPPSVNGILFRGSSLNADIKVSDLKRVNLSLASSNLRIILTNVSDASIDITSSNAHLDIARFGTYTLRIISSNVIINTQATPCLEISAISSVVEYPGGSIIGSITSPAVINSTGGSCQVRLGVNSMSSVVNIS